LPNKNRLKDFPDANINNSNDHNNNNNFFQGRRSSSGSGILNTQYLREALAEVANLQNVNVNVDVEDDVDIKTSANKRHSLMLIPE
jgi:hypothetical protein